MTKLAEHKLALHRHLDPSYLPLWFHSKGPNLLVLLIISGIEWKKANVYISQTCHDNNCLLENFVLVIFSIRLISWREIISQVTIYFLFYSLDLEDFFSHRGMTVFMVFVVYHIVKNKNCSIIISTFNIISNVLLYTI